MEMLSVKKFLSKLFIIFFSVISCGSLVFSQCFNCVKFHQRYENGMCPLDESGCTTCINGSVIDPENLNTCIELNVTKKPAQETRVALGGVVIIDCLVSTKIECLWKKDGKVMDLARHPRYQLKIQTEAYTTDCSLVIYNASPEDEGVWTCTNRPIDHEFNNNFTIAEHARVYVEQPAVVEPPLGVCEIVFIAIGVGLTLVVIIIFAIRKCYTLILKKMSSPIQEEPSNLIDICTNYGKKCVVTSLNTMRGPSVGIVAPQ